MRRLLSVLATLAALGLVATPTASAHTGLVRGSPGPGDTVRPGAELVELTLESIDPAGAHEIALLDADDESLPVGEVRAAGDTTVCARTDPLEPGVHSIAYSVTSADGHLVTGRYSFDVARGGDRPPPTECPVTRLTAPTTPPAIAGVDVEGMPRPVLWLSVTGSAAVLAASLVVLWRRRRRAAHHRPGG